MLVSGLVIVEVDELVIAEVDKIVEAEVDELVPELRVPELRGVYICGGLKIWRPFFKLSTIVLYFLIDLIIFYLINRDTFILS